MNEMPESSIKALPARRWRKVLYEDQGVPDNYVDESFLDEMKKNRKCSSFLLHSGAFSCSINRRRRIHVTLLACESRRIFRLLLCAAENYRQRNRA